MASSQPKDLLQQVPGRLIINPTNAGLKDRSDSSHGGTVLGKSFKNTFTIVENSFEVTGIEFGGMPLDYVEVGHKWAFSGMCRVPDPDFYERIFPGASGHVTGLPFFGSPTSFGLASTRAVELLFAADDPNHLSLLMFSAVAMIDKAASLSFYRGANNEFGFAFRGLVSDDPNDSAIKRTYKMGSLESFYGLLAS